MTRSSAARAVHAKASTMATANARGCGIDRRLAAVCRTRNRLLARVELAEVLQRVRLLWCLVVADACDAREAEREAGMVRRAALQIREQHLDHDARRDEHGRS